MEFAEFLKDNLKFSSKSHPLEQGLMLASTYLIEAYRTTKDHILRMIVISDGPTEGTLDLTHALLGLLDNFKYFLSYLPPDSVPISPLKTYTFDVIDAEKTLVKIMSPVNPEEYLSKFPAPGLTPLQSAP